MNLGLSIRVRTRDQIPIFDLKGDIIGSWALELKERLLEAGEQGTRHLILNFRDVTSIDGLGVMVIAGALTGGLCIRGVHLSSSCREMFEKHGVELITYTDENSALETFRDVAPVFPERRRAPRTKTRFPVECTTPHGSFRGVLLDVSEGGALLGYYDPLQEEEILGSNLILDVEVRLIGHIRLAGKAVGHRDHLEMPAVGLSLLRPSPPLPDLGKEL